MGGTHRTLAQVPCCSHGANHGHNPPLQTSWQRQQGMFLMSPYKYSQETPFHSKTFTVFFCSTIHAERLSFLNGWDALRMSTFSRMFCMSGLTAEGLWTALSWGLHFPSLFPSLFSFPQLMLLPRQNSTKLCTNLKKKIAEINLSTQGWQTRKLCRQSTGIGLENNLREELVDFSKNIMYIYVCM